jgi:hypothetical protein
MKNQHIVLFLFASLMVASGTAAQTLDWQAVEKLGWLTRISVKTQQRTICIFEKATDDKLYCRYRNTSDVLVFNRAEIREVRIAPYDWSQGPPLIFAAGGGGGVDSAGQPTSFAGVKVGDLIVLDLQYDHIQGKSGFTTEGSAMLPLFRVPRPQEDKTKKYLKVYAEPGMGYRAGGGSFGGYTSAKVMLALLSDERWGKPMPYIEFQRRFPFDSPMQGDTRVAIGVMIAICRHCGAD